MPVRPLSPGTIGDGPDGSLVDLAYGLGEQYEREGDLEQAAQWFRRAAEADRGRAALRLGDVLGRLADERPPGSERLLAEATRWIAGAPDATTPDAIELITDMLNRHQRAAARRGLEAANAG